MTLGFGLMIMLDETSSLYAVVYAQVFRHFD